MRLSALLLILPLLVMAACQPAPPPPTATPAPTFTPEPTATPLPTLAPLPTVLPTPTNVTSSDGTAAQAELRIVHANPALSQADIYLDDQIIGFSLRYGRISGETTVAPGDYQLRLLPPGGRSDAAPLLEAPITLAPDTPLNVVLMPDENGTDTAVRLLEADHTPLNANTSRLTFLHAIPNGEFVLLRDPNSSDASLLIPDFEFGSQSESLELPSGPTVLNIEPFAPAYDIELRPRYSYTLILAGTPEQPDILVLDESVPGLAELGFANVSEQFNSVDVYINGELGYAGAARCCTGDLVGVSVGPHDVSVYEAEADPTTTEPLLSQRVTVNADDVLWLLFMGTVDDLRLVPVTLEPDPTAEDETRITIVNSLSRVPAAQQNRGDIQPLTALYARPTTSTFRAGLVQMEFIRADTADNDDYTIVELVSREFEAGESYLLVLTGAVDDEDAYLVSRRVGIEGDNAPTADAIPDPLVYLFNTTDMEVQFLVDGAMVASSIPPGGSSAALPLPFGEHTFTLNDVDTLQQIYTTSRLLVGGERYTQFFVGDRSQNTILAFPYDPPDASTDAAIRLLNLSGDTDAQLGLASVPAVPEDRRPTNFVATQQAEAPDTPLRELSLPVEASTYEGSAGNSGITPTITIAPGLYDLYVFDVNTRQIMAVQYAKTIEAGQLYDMIALPGGTLTPLQAQISSYPTP